MKHSPKVINIGPDRKAPGGMAAVLNSYQKYVSGFKQLTSNSRHGTIAGLFALSALMLRLPLMRAAGYSIVHIHSTVGKSFVRKRLILNWAKLWGYRTVFHIHGGSFPRELDKLGRKRAQRFIDRCSAIAVLSQSWKDYFESSFQCKRVIIVPNIVEAPSAPVLRRTKEKGERIEMLFMGMINDQKGIFELIDALATVKSRHGNDAIHLTVGGTGDMERLNNQIERLELTDMVTCAGWLAGKDKEEALRKADIMILPSHADCLPVCLLEAKMMSIPSIATRVGGVPDIITDGVSGNLFDAGDKDAMVSAIESYISDPSLLFTRGEAAHRDIMQNLPERVADLLSDFYRTL